MLSSARVLDSLFYSAAVVVEADSDAKFYQLASRRRSENLDLHFVNADNKQTVPRILSVYRDMGVRSAGIVDFDVLNDHTEFKQQLVAIGVDLAEMAEALQIRDRIAVAAKETSPDDRLSVIRDKLKELERKLQDLGNHTFATPPPSAGWL